MKCKEILQRIEEVYPADYAMEWDNVGLLAGRYEKEVKRIYVALDATEEVNRSGDPERGGSSGHTSPYDLCAAKEDHRCRIYREPPDPADPE